MASREERDKLIARQMERLSCEFPDLRLARGAPGRSVVRGRIGFTVTWDGIEIDDEYTIEVTIPADYPDSSPAVREVGGRIPRNPDWHVNPGDGELCLGTPLAVKRRFARHRNLLEFIKEQVIPFLFWVSYKRETGHAPFGQLPHGPQGLIQYYKEVFSTDDRGVLQLLMALAYPGYPEDSPCPCQSGLKLKRCHEKILKKVGKHRSPEEFRDEYRTIYDHLCGVPTI